jgi:hypothetical protein
LSNQHDTIKRKVLVDMVHTHLKLIVAFICVLIITVLRVCWIDSDTIPVSIFGGSYGDAAAWAECARNKYLYGYWFNNVDDWRPVFIVPFHSFIHYLSFRIFGLTNLGFSATELFSVAIIQLILICQIPKDINKYLQSTLAVFILFSCVLLGLSRLPALDTNQVALIFVGLFFCKIALDKEKILWWALGSIFVTFGVLYKVSAICMLVIPPLLAFSVNKFIYRHNMSRSLIKTNVIISFSICVVFTSIYYLTWVNPRLDEIIYQSWRMFGTQAKIVMPWEYEKVFRNIIYLISTPWGPSYDNSIRQFHASWIMTTLIAYPLLLNVVFKIKKIKSYWDLIIIVTVPIVFIQIIMFDMQWRRYFVLIPLSYVLLIRLVSLYSETKNRIKVESLLLKIFLGFVTIYSLFLFITKYLFQIGFKNWNYNYQLILLVMFVSLVIFGIYYKISNKKKYQQLFAGAIILLFSLFSIDSLRGVHELFNAPSSRYEMAKKIGDLTGEEVRNIVSPAQYLSPLYHSNITRYYGTFSGGWKPDGFLDKFGMTINESIKNYRKNGTQNSNSIPYKVLDKIQMKYPDFIERWYLPEDYEQVYSSNLFVNDDAHLAKRHLLIDSFDVDFLVKDPRRPHATDILDGRGGKFEKIESFIVRDTKQPLKNFASIKFNNTVKINLYQKVQ